MRREPQPDHGGRHRHVRRLPRARSDGETKFGCVDGPDFDGHAVDFEELMSRQRVYTDEERVADAEYSEECSCHL